MTATVSIGRLHLLVHELLRRHDPHPSEATKLRASYPLRTEQAATAAALAEIDRWHVPFGDPDAPPKPCQCNQHGILRGDLARLDAALDRVWADRPDDPGGLLDQVADPDGRTLQGRAGDGGGGGGKPGSRPPVDLAGADLLARVAAGVRTRHGEIRSALGDTGAAPYPSWQDWLWQLPTLASRLPETGPDLAREQHPLVRAVHRDLNGWRNSALIYLGQLSPMVTLTTPCPHCGETSMIVREDATSDVVCTTESCIDPTTQETSRWPRHAWEALLAGRYAAGTVNTEAAALHLGVAAATIRDWKRRGLISPVGGTARHPLWRLRDLVKAAAEPKTVRPVPGPPVVWTPEAQLAEHRAATA